MWNVLSVENFEYNEKAKNTRKVAETIGKCRISIRIKFYFKITFSQSIPFNDNIVYWQRRHYWQNVSPVVLSLLAHMWEWGRCVWRIKEFIFFFSYGSYKINKTMFQWTNKQILIYVLLAGINSYFKEYALTLSVRSHMNINALYHIEGQFYLKCKYFVFVYFLWKAWTEHEHHYHSNWKGTYWNSLKSLGEKNISTKWVSKQKQI